MLRLAVAACLVVTASLSAATREEEAKKYAADLKSKDAKARVTALKELGRLGQIQKRLTEPHIDAITGRLKDSDGQVRGEAARTLGLIDPPDTKAAITAIADLLKDEKSQDAREGQEMGLGELGGTAEEADLKALARKALTDARGKANDKREQKTIQAALLLINGPKKKN
jgi:hypothetical protein